jgi:subtilisin family serine protease
MGIRVPRWLRVVGTVAAGGWIVAVVAAVSVVGWVAGQYGMVTETGSPWWAWGAAGVVAGGVAAVPAVPLVLVARRPAARAAGRAWLAGIVLMVVLLPVRALPIGQPGSGYLATAAICWLAVLAVRVGRPARRGTAPGAVPMGAVAGAVPMTTAPGAVPMGAVAGLVLLVPWLWAGALGSWYVTVAGLVAAAGLGALAGTVLSGGFWAAFATGPAWRRILCGGAASGVALVPLCAAAGQGGAQLALLVTVPVLGFAAATLYRPGSTGLPRGAALYRPAGAGLPRGVAAYRPAAGTGRPLGVAVGVAAAGPLLLVAPEQLTPLLGTRDVGWYALLATVSCLALAILLAVAYPVVLRHRLPRRPVAAGLAVLALAGAAAVYATAGQPGFHGDRLFVVLRAQADLTGTARIAGQRDRAAAVYRRLVRTARVSQRPLRAALGRLGIGFTPYYLVDAIEVDADDPVLRQWLSARSDVDRVLLSPRLRPIHGVPHPMRGTATTPDTPLWNLQAIQADRVVEQLHADGRGIVLGTSDSGVDGAHPVLRDNFRGGTDSWYDPWYGSTTPTDYQGHGTHTTATAVGTGGVGVAPGARWIGCVDLARNLGNPARYVACLQFMLAPFPHGGSPFRGDPRRGAQVLTNSWACPPMEGCDAGALAPATRALKAAGVFVVAAAGNTGPRCGSADDPIGRYRNVLTVGAVDRSGHVAGFSSRSAGKPDLVAPGVDVQSALPGTGYGELSGTSMATPQVAGTVALMWSANPALVGRIDTTTRILESTATPLPAAPRCAGHDAAGAGLLDAYAAVRAAQRVQ